MSMWWKCGAALLCVVLLAAGADPVNLPDLAPLVRSLYPLGGCRGSTVEIEIHGRNLEGLQEIACARPDIRGEVLSSEEFQARIRVTVGAGAPVGIQDYRLRTARGTFVGVFHVGG